MRRSVVICVAMAFICGPAFGASPSPHDAAKEPEVEEVVVTGEQPGPQLWKAMKDGRILWIYGTVTPKPRDMTWRSKQVVQVLGNIDEVIDQQLQATSWPANIALGPDTRNPVKLFKMGRRLQKIRDANASPPLREVLSPELYERFARQRNRYAPNHRTIEGMRPRQAANLLYEAAISQAGLTSRAMIHDEVHRLARKHRVEVSEVTLPLRFDPATMETIQTEFNEIPPVAELECFEATLLLIERDIPTITARANAWAIGDVNALQALPSLRREACDRVRWSAPRWAGLDAQLEWAWVSTIEAAVARNDATLVLVDVAEILESDGLVSRLIERGYAVEGPAVSSDAND